MHDDQMPVAMVSRKAAKHMKHMMDKNEEAKTGFLFRFLVDFSFAHVSGDMGLVGVCMVWYGMVWYGMVWYGMVWYGMVWYGMVWYGM